MDVVIGVLFTAFVLVVAYLALKQGRQNRGKSYEQRRDEVYKGYEQRMEEFKKTEAKGRDPRKGD